VIRVPGVERDVILSESELARYSRHLVMPEVGLSASDLRRRVAASLGIRYRTPRAVEKYIETKGLYK